MLIPNNVNKYMNEISNNISYDEIIYSGSISDYFNFKIKNIDVNIGIKDIDLNVKNISSLKKIEKLFNVNSKLFISCDLHDHYQIILKDNLIIDVFIPKELYEYCEGEYNGKKILYTSLLGRYKMLIDTLKTENNNFYDNRYVNRIFKHLKKIMIYKRIIDGKH